MLASDLISVRVTPKPISILPEPYMTQNTRKPCGIKNMATYNGNSVVVKRNSTSVAPIISFEVGHRTYGTFCSTL